MYTLWLGHYLLDSCFSSENFQDGMRAGGSLPLPIIHICDRASEKGPSGHKLHLITKQFISLVLHNKFIFCKL